MTQSKAPLAVEGIVGVKTARYSAKIEQIENIQGFVREQASLASCPDSVTMRLELIIEELVVNIISYGYKDQQGDLEVTCSFTATQEGGRNFFAAFKDWGIPFNPLERVTVELSDDLEIRNPGGVGLLITQEMAHLLNYAYDDGNILTVGFRY